MSELEKHIASTYDHLRIGMAILALALPPVLVAGGWLLGGSLLSSMSAYYHTAMRDVFVGTLWAVGTFLYLYKGFGEKENIALNVAGVLAIGVALFPTPRVDGGCASDCTLWQLPYVHGACAVAFFVAIAYVCIFRSGDTLPLMSDRARAARYRNLYRTFGVAMLVLPAVAAVLVAVLQLDLDPGKRAIVLAIEAMAVWVFGAYWFVKSREIGATRADQRPAEVQAACAARPGAQAVATG